MLNNMIIRLLVYYAAWLLALSGIFHLFPQILYYVAQERKRIFVAKVLGVRGRHRSISARQYRRRSSPAYRSGTYHSSHGRFGAGLRGYAPHYLGLSLDAAAQEIQSILCAYAARDTYLHNASRLFG